MSVNLLIETAPLGITKHMTAGSDPQPAESSTAPKMPSVSSIRHIPHILDHNYGQPPPMTPPDSNSPGPEDGDTGNEDDEDDGVTRCICNFDHDDGYMICCDKCSVWQHIECMGISSDAVPENYLCDQCQPRTLDRERARAIQERKKEEQSDDDDDDDDSEDERDTPTYTAVSNTPTRITLTAKVSQKRKRGPNKIKVKDQNVIHVESTDKEKKPKKRRRQKQKLPAGFVPVDEDTSEAWDSTCNSYDNNYEELKENIYGMELEQLALNSIQENGCLPAVANDEQLCKVVEVQRCRKGIVATEDMDKNKFVIQCKGKLMLLSKFEAENPFFKRCSPYVFYYSELDHLQLCVDARTHGNDARFARRSCSPNSEVKHFLFNGRMCLGIFSSCPLPKGSEITIPFEFQFEEYHSYLDCACRQETCAIMKYNLKLQNQNNDGHVPHKRFKLHDEDSNSGSNQKMSPLRVSLSNSHGLQGDSDSDLENNPEKRAKKSREERKLEAYLKQIEKMEKKEKRKQQTQKDHKHEQISPVSQEAPFNKLSSKNIKVMKRTLNKRRTGTPGFKRKRARLSSCSSEPLSPDDHSSTASTPTTPKVTSASSPPDVQEPCSVTPSTSPSRSFRFPKDSKQYVEEEVKETPCRNSVPALKTEPVDHSEPSAPCSPTTPQDDSDSKPVLCTANSTTDQEQLPDTSDIVTEAGNDAVCTSTTDSGQLNKDLSKSLSECLVEMNASAGSGRNTPSPCPSTAGSPTSAESVASGYSGSATERTSPGPAPGSPVATIKFGPRVSRTSPLYGSLKKRWLFQYLCGQNLVNERPPNGIRISVGNSMPRPVNGKTIPPSLRRNGLPKIIDPLPLKKRHLRKFQNMTSESEFTFKETVQSLARQPLREEPLIVSSPVPLEQQVQIVLADSVNNLQPHKQEPITNNEQLVPNEEAGLKKDISAVPDSVESPYMTSLVSSQGTVVSIAATTAGILPRRPSDPRLVNSSPVSSSTNSAVSPGGGFPVVTSAVSPGASSVSGQPVLQFSQNSDSSGTPGKKKVSLLEYRNRSRNRLSVDLPRPPPPPPPSNAPATAPCVTPSSAFSSSVIKSSSLSSSLPNLSAPSTTSSLLHRSVSSSGEMNGPHLEPVSPDLEDKSGVFHQSSKRPSSTYGRGSYSSRLESKGVIYGDGDSRLKREIQKKHEQLTRKEEGKVKLEKTLTSLISEELQKDAKSRSTAMLGQSPSSTSTESSNPSAELTGDAMDIEDDDSNCNSSIYVTTPSIPPSTHPHSTLAHSTQLPHRSSLLSQFQQPSANYRIGHSHHPPVYLSQQAASQLPSPSQPPTRLPSNSPQYLVTSPSGSAHVRFQSPYQAPPSQAASFFHH